MKHFGNEKTHLTLSKEAFAIYSETDPLDIYEYETKDGYRYNITGAITAEGLTADEVNWILLS